MMDNKRPWSHGPYKVYYGIIGDWYAHDTSTGESVCFKREAEARLFASAHALYEALEEIVQAADGDGWSQLDPCLKTARAALRAANPDAFDGEGK